MNKTIIQLLRTLLKFLAFNIPLYNEVFARGGGLIGVLIGISALRIESVLRGMCFSSFSAGERILVGRHVLINQGKGRIHFGEGVIINHQCVLTADREGGFIEIGDNSHIDCFSAIHGQGGIKIGNKCAISSGVIVYSQSNQYKHDPRLSIVDQPIVFSEVVIEDGVWIGANATILPGVKIGKGAVIGAGALVNKSVPDGCIVVGVPARVLGDREN